MKLADKTAVVTGAGSGIGRGIAECFAREGAKVIAVGRTAAKLEKARGAAGDAAQRLFPRAADVSEKGPVHELFEQVIAEFGRIDILVNNAGTNVPKRALDVLSVEDFELMVKVNLTGAYNCIHAVLPHMRQNKDGLIINISSIAGVRASTLGGAGYSASKFGLSALSYCVGLEEGVNGIRSCMICPGEVNTPILENRAVVPTAEQRAVMLQPEDLAQAALMVALLHPRATVPELIICPTIQKFS